MGIISKETFDKFTEEEKRRLRQQYSHLLKVSEDDEDWNVRMCAGSEKQSLINVFGKENLQPKPKIKTWEDVKKQEDVDCNFYTNKDDLAEYLCLKGWDVFGDHNKLINKLQATLKIAKLIELGYGGMVTKEEHITRRNLYTTDRFWAIWVNGEGKIECTAVEDCIDLLVFHEREQAQEFMSYPENRKLVEQYYML